MATSAATPRPTSLLGRVAGWCFDHRTKAIGLWLVAFVAIFGAAGAVGSQFSSNAQVPGSGSAAGFAVLAEHFPELGTGGQTGTIVFRAAQGIDDPEVVERRVEESRIGRQRTDSEAIPVGGA